MFYKIDSTRVSLREYWWGTRSPLVVFAWMTKWFRVQIPSSSDDPNVDSIGQFEMDEASLPPAILAAFEPRLTELQGLGFGRPVWHIIQDPLSFTWIYWATCWHSSGQVIARIHNRIWAQPHPTRNYLFPIFISAFDDGTFLNSSAGKADMLSAPTVRTQYLTGKDTATLWNAHLQLLQQEMIRKPVTLVRSDDELRNITELFHAAERDFHLTRGVFKPRTEEEEQQSAVIRHAQEAAANTGFEHPEVLTEIHALQQKKASASMSIVLLAVSLIAFLAAGQSQSSWKFLLILVPILLFHELGHYLAMLIFGYRNVRMFFIPFFGAAVVGHHYNVPGWKKTMVSLMGPLPGIVLGIPIGIAGIMLHKPEVTHVAELLLIINGFNLLPVLPLDGGWALHATLFCRHPVVDAVFRVVAALGLLGLSLLLQTRFLMYTAIPLLVSLPMTYRCANIARNLREQGYASASPDDQTIPPATAQTIITQLKTAFPKGQSSKSIAQMTLNVFELMNAKPPGWPATIGLLALHGATICFAVVFALVFVVGQKGSLAGFLGAAARAASQHRMTCEDHKKAPGKQADATSPKKYIIATLEKPDLAAQQFTRLSAQVPDDGTLALFGQSLIISLPNADDAARQKWFAEFQKLDKQTFVITTNSGASLSLTFIAPTEEVAKEIQSELEGYFMGDQMFLIPPWVSPDPRSATERQQHQRARQTYRAARDATSFSYTNAALKGFAKQMNEAVRQGDTEKAKRISTEQTLRTKEVQNEALEAIRNNPAYDMEVLERYKLELQNSLPDNYGSGMNMNALKEHVARRKKLLLETGKLLGQLPLSDGRPDGPLAAQSASFGGSRREGLLIQLSWVSFANPVEGPDRLIAWLCGKSCVDFKYQLTGGGFGGLVDPEDE